MSFWHTKPTNNDLKKLSKRTKRKKIKTKVSNRRAGKKEETISVNEILLSLSNFFNLSENEQKIFIYANIK